jgi:hypothetical protein
VKQILTSYTNILAMLEAEKLYDLDRRSAAVLICMMYIA